ncbi:DUF2861 family protein [Enterovibrio nigricans]|uniref:DUF2861 domain-containing protein n=1 Tax=Enterovibrio nigricans DSM 22720 TaxID=1121868 RepID=A0A1T4V5B2_9GAMM|nr:DUF2861 family protein [Enterovibrio nigricans]PKF50404.1 DUF2861 domain-containing protein [Enterovibrio nigricans]SKA60155.1 Protein of unknown function [Enterovibrio nigricans DSM 22720]
MNRWVFLTLWLFWPGSVFAAWFSGSDALTSAHQKLLEGNTAESFDAMVEAWQQENGPAEKRHMADLLSLAITEDCGRSLSTLSLPSWLQNIVIRRETVQTPNRVFYHFSIYGSSSAGVSSVSFSAWPDRTVLHSNFVDDESRDFKLDYDGLSRAIKAGLYKLDVTSNNGERWSSNVLITQPEAIQAISWKDSRSWRIAPPTDLKGSCPRPFLSMNLYSQNDGESAPIWSEEKDKNLPTALPVIDVPNGQYWFSVALIERRWQGAILLEEVQRIGRSVDLPDVDLQQLTPKRQ